MEKLQLDAFFHIQEILELPSKRTNQKNKISKLLSLHHKIRLTFTDSTSGCAEQLISWAHLLANPLVNRDGGLTFI